MLCGTLASFCSLRRWCIFSGASSPLDGPGVGNLMLGIRRVYAGTTPRYTRDLNRRSTKNTPNAPPKTLQKVMFFMIGSFTGYPPDYTPLYAGYTPCYQIDYVYAQGIRRYTPGIRRAVKSAGYTPRVYASVFCGTLASFCSLRRWCIFWAFPARWTDLGWGI